MVVKLDWYIECATGTHRECNSSLGACVEALIGTLGSSRAGTLLGLQGLS